MSLLQNFDRTLDQIEWFLSNSRLERYPGAFLSVAGNLCRQVLEQIQFVLAFYSGLPRSEYLRPDGGLKTAGTVWNALNRENQATGRTFFEEARRRGSRIRKFARNPRSLKKWRLEFNEPSHFLNPATNRKMKERHIRLFVSRIRELVDPLDNFLVLAAVNEMRTQGKVLATLGEEPENVPGIQTTVIIKPSGLILEDGRLALSSRVRSSIRVLNEVQEECMRWSTGVSIISGAIGFRLNFMVLTEDGIPVDLSTLHSIIGSLMSTPDGRRKTISRLKRLGLKVKFH